MFRRFYYSLLIVLLALFTAGSGYAADTYNGMGRLPGAWVVNYKGVKTVNCVTDGSDPNCKDGTKEISCTPGNSDADCRKILLGNCDPKADPALDTVAGKPSYQKSCISQNIDRSNFTVKVKFDPKQPTTNLNGQSWGNVSISVPGGPTFPGSYITDANGAKTFYLSTCSGLTVPASSTCSDITTVYVNGSAVTVAGKTFTYSGGVGGDIAYNGSTAYLAPVTQKVPTSGAVQTQLKVSGVGVTTKCKSSSTGLPAQSNRQPTSASGPCDSGKTPILNADGTLISTAVPVMVDMVYSSTINATITSDGVTRCTAGVTQQYASGRYVRDELCAPIKDTNRCISENKSSSNCDRYVTGGGNVYDSNGILMTSTGDPVVSVQGASTTTTSPSSIFSMVFGNVPTRTYAIPDNTLAEINKISEKSTDLKVGDTPKPIPGTEITLVNFQLRYEGEYACVYAFGQDANNEWRVEGDYPRSLNQVYDVTGESPAMNMADQPLTPEYTGNLTPTKTSYCVYAPAPSVNNNPLVWNSLISPICTNYNASSSEFKDSKGNRRSFTGVVVECIEDTMMGVFHPTASAGGGQTKTFFSSMQEKLQSAIRAVMALFVVLFGYRLIINKKVPDRKEWTWTMLKFALVIYFAAGSGMVDLFPRMLSISKNLSLIVMQAGLGIVADNGVTSAQSAASSAANAVTAAQTAIDNKNVEILQLESQLSSISTQLITLDTQLTAAAVTRDTSLATKNNLALLLSNAQQGLTNYNTTKQNKINSLNTSISNINNQITTITNTINLQTAQIGNLNNQKAQLDIEITNLEDTITNLQNTFSANNDSTAYTSGSGAYSAPSFCEQVKIQVWGGGQSGHTGGKGKSDGSGGAGGYIEDTITANAGKSINYSVGSGGDNESSGGSSSSASYRASNTNVVITGGGGDGDGGTSSYSPSTYSGSIVKVNGGGGGNSHGGCHVGGQAHNATSVSDKCPCAGGSRATFGNGGCSGDYTGWAYGGNGRVKIACTQFDFSDLTNIKSGDTDANTIVTNTQNLTSLRNNLEPSRAAFQSQIDAITAQKTANEAILAQYRANLQTDTDQLAYIQNSTPESVSEQSSLVASLQAQYDAAAAQYNTDLAAYDALNSQKTSLLSQQSILNSQLIVLQNQLAALQTSLTSAQQTYNNAQQTYNNLVTGGGQSQIAENNTGYAYCDFRAFKYKSGKEYMQLWDMLDCKISKYLGIGDNSKYSDIPQVFVVAMLAPISSAYGIPIFILSIIFLVTVVMITVRMVHIYIMAFLAMLMLVFISPLVIPSVFFEATKYMFTQWMQQLIAYWLQPVILFAFLSFMFAAIDSVMFGSNYSFSADNKLKNSIGVVTPSNTKCGTSSPAANTDDTVCKDKYAPGYLYQVLKINQMDFPHSSFKLFSIPRIDFGSDEGKYLCIGLLKLLIISFIVHSMLSILQDMSSKFVGAMAGANTLSGVATPSPAAVLAGISAAGSAAKNLGESTIDSMKKTGHAIKHYKSTGGAIKRAALNLPPVQGGRAAYKAAAWISDKVSEVESRRQDNLAKNAVGNMLKDEAIQGEKGNAEFAHQLMKEMANKGAQRVENRSANEAARKETEDDPGIAGMFARNSADAEATREERTASRSAINAVRHETENTPGVAEMFARNSAEAEASRTERAERKGINANWENSKGDKESKEDFGLARMFNESETDKDST